MSKHQLLLTKQLKLTALTLQQASDNIVADE